MLAVPPAGQARRWYHAAAAGTRAPGLRPAVVTPGDGDDELEGLLAEQIGSYRALAGEYEDHALDLPGGEELVSALDASRPEGDVLEIACGPGFWTSRLLRHARTVTALDAASEMLAIASARIEGERARFIHADVFSWRPDRHYDVVCFGFWLSHMPAERFGAFWSLATIVSRHGAASSLPTIATAPLRSSLRRALIDDPSAPEQWD